jgi:hypothetical protein
MQWSRLVQVEGLHLEFCIARTILDREMSHNYVDMTKVVQTLIVVMPLFLEKSLARIWKDPLVLAPFVALDELKENVPM